MIWLGVQPMLDKSFFDDFNEVNKDNFGGK